MQGVSDEQRLWLDAFVDDVQERVVEAYWAAIDSGRADPAVVCELAGVLFASLRGDVELFLCDLAQTPESPLHRRLTELGAHAGHIRVMLNDRDNVGIPMLIPRGPREKLYAPPEEGVETLPDGTTRHYVQHDAGWFYGSYRKAYREAWGGRKRLELAESFGRIMEIDADVAERILRDGTATRHEPDGRFVLAIPD